MLLVPVRVEPRVPGAVQNRIRKDEGEPSSLLQRLFSHLISEKLPQCHLVVIPNAEGLTARPGYAPQRSLRKLHRNADTAQRPITDLGA